MHIAVCMDVAPDRKQLERLLGRSADRRLAIDPSVPYYVQSYGNKEALLARPFMYDLFFIDLVNDDIDSIELTRRLRSLGVTATIALCPGSEDLSDKLCADDNVLVLRQPVMVEELEKVLDTALSDAKARLPKLDIRAKGQTLLINEDDFCYAERTGDISIDVHLYDSEVVSCSETLENLRIRCEKFSEILCLSKDLIVHKKYIMSTSFGRVTLKDGESFRVHNKYIKLLR